MACCTVWHDALFLLVSEILCLMNHFLSLLFPTNSSKQPGYYVSSCGNGGFMGSLSLWQIGSSVCVERRSGRGDGYMPLILDVPLQEPIILI